MIDWAITNKCNLDCLHCRGMPKEELDTKTILRVAEQIPSLKPRWVIIEGGEPLLRKELFKILETIQKRKIKTYLISNAVLFNGDLARRFAELNINLIISIDGADKQSYEKIRRGASFEKLKESVAIANEYGISDSCPVTIGKHNYHQIGKLFKFAEEIGYKKITFLGLKPCKDYERYVLNERKYEKFFFSVIENQMDYQMDVYVDEPFFEPFLKEYHIDYSQNPENGIIVPDVSHCIFGEYMFIETNGGVNLVALLLLHWAI
jgi:MoaA/NifB/PqqE/SkfB family radical SAM enzyme